MLNRMDTEEDIATWKTQSDWQLMQYKAGDKPNCVRYQFADAELARRRTVRAGRWSEARNWLALVLSVVAIVKSFL
jgi:hypothetical protein